MDFEGKVIWHKAFCGIVWLIWLYKKDIVFNSKSWNSVETFDIIKLKITWWLKAKKKKRK